MYKSVADITRAVRRGAGILFFFIAGAAFTWQHLSVVPATGQESEWQQTEAVNYDNMSPWQLYMEGLKVLKSGNPALSGRPFL